MANPARAEELEMWFNRAVSARNERTRGLPLTRMRDFAWETAIVWPDHRPGPFEGRRFVALGLINDRLHVAAFAYDGRVAVALALREIGCGRIARRRRDTMWELDDLPSWVEERLILGGSARSILGRNFISRAPGVRRRQGIDPDLLARARFDRAVGRVRRGTG